MLKSISMTLMIGLASVLSLCGPQLRGQTHLNVKPSQLVVITSYKAAPGVTRVNQMYQNGVLTNLPDGYPRVPKGPDFILTEILFEATDSGEVVDRPYWTSLYVEASSPVATRAMGTRLALKGASMDVPRGWFGVYFGAAFRMDPMLGWSSQSAKFQGGICIKGGMQFTAGTAMYSDTTTWTTFYGYFAE